MSSPFALLDRPTGEPALVDAGRGRIWTQDELAHAARSFAEALTTTRRELVFCLCGADVASVIGYLGAIHAGHAVALLDAAPEALEKGLSAIGRSYASSVKKGKLTEGEVQQYIPLLRDNWVIALRALTSLTQNAGAGDVPFFLMPNLGGNDTLRGYPSWRFRDRNRLLLSGEYRWTAGSFVDMALFLDAGQVASRASDFGLDRFKKTYGVGLMLHTMTSSLTRIDLARTPEGNSLVFSFSPRF